MCITIHTLQRSLTTAARAGWGGDWGWGCSNLCPPVSYVTRIHLLIFQTYIFGTIALVVNYYLWAIMAGRKELSDNLTANKTLLADAHWVPRKINPPPQKVLIVPAPAPAGGDKDKDKDKDKAAAKPPASDAKPSAAAAGGSNGATTAAAGGGHFGGTEGPSVSEAAQPAQLAAAPAPAQSRAEAYHGTEPQPYQAAAFPPALTFTAYQANASLSYPTWPENAYAGAAVRTAGGHFGAPAADPPPEKSAKTGAYANKDGVFEDIKDVMESEEVKTFKKLRWGAGPVRLFYGLAYVDVSNEKAWKEHVERIDDWFRLIFTICVTISVGCILGVRCAAHPTLPTRAPRDTRSFLSTAHIPRHAQSVAPAPLHS